MTAIGVFTHIGNKEFRDFIQNLKINANTPIPLHLLYQSPFSTTFKPEIKIENVPFKTRYEFGMYLAQLFERIPRNALMKNEELWNWLVLYYIEQLIPINSQGKREMGEIARYVYNPRYTKYYLHLVAATWDIYTRLGTDSKLFLMTPLNKINKFFRELAARQNMISNKNLIRTVQLLYLEEMKDGKEGIKKGAYSRKKQGNLYRFIAVMNQLDTNYDLYAMKPENLLNLLPAEFDVWKPQKETRRRSILSRITQ
ncbi:MAG: hypothetical protein APR54_01540 [Candidatus Cloacimonas sp. SDB]|nr:MAG: hypothetical protein APR54_01540 [Candidatus Cloacimonas sp. SDB]